MLPGPNSGWLLLCALDPYNDFTPESEWAKSVHPKAGFVNRLKSGDVGMLSRNPEHLMHHPLCSTTEVSAGRAELSNLFCTT